MNANLIANAKTEHVVEKSEKEPDGFSSLCYPHNEYEIICYGSEALPQVRKINNLEL